MLDTIARFIRSRGYSPTLKEIGELLGIHSSCTIFRHLQGLECKGYISRVPNIARGIVLRGEGSDRSTVQVTGGQISSFRERNYVQLEGVKHPKDDGYLMQFALLRLLGMADDENGTVRPGRLSFDPDPEAEGGQ